MAVHSQVVLVASFLGHFFRLIPRSCIQHQPANHSVHGCPRRLLVVPGLWPEDIVRQDTQVWHPRSLLSLFQMLQALSYSCKMRAFCCHCSGRWGWVKREQRRFEQPRSGFVPLSQQSEECMQLQLSSLSCPAVYHSNSSPG